MVFTIADWVVLIVLAIIGIIFSIAFFLEGNVWAGLAVLLATIMVCLGFITVVNWYNTNTAKGQRAVKDYVSNIQGGLNREITITAEDGREIFHYEGKVDVETKHEGSANYILFESEEGLRYIIYYGIQDTVLIIEKAG